MSKTIRDFERDGMLNGIIKKCYERSYFSPVAELKWTPTTNPPPERGQKVLACKNNGFDIWVDTVYYFNGYFFDDGWTWAKEYGEYDAWMPMPLPMNYKEEQITWKK